MLCCCFFNIISVFNLCNNTDVDYTKKRIENYKKENKEIIKKNLSKLVRNLFSCVYTFKIIVC